MPATTTLLVTTRKKEQNRIACNVTEYYGIWHDLAEFSDKESFLDACADFHSDEDNPEFLFLESSLPPCLVREDDVSEYIWAMTDTHYDVLDAAIAFVDWQGYWDDNEFEDAYIDEFSSPEAYAMYYLEKRGLLDKVPECLRGYIDIESFAYDLELSCDIYCCDTSDGTAKHIFNRNY